MDAIDRSDVNLVLKEAAMALFNFKLSDERQFGNILFNLGGNVAFTAQQLLYVISGEQKQFFARPDTMTTVAGLAASYCDEQAKDPSASEPWAEYAAKIRKEVPSLLENLAKAQRLEKSDNRQVTPPKPIRIPGLQAIAEQMATMHLIEKIPDSDKKTTFGGYLEDLRDGQRPVVDASKPVTNGISEAARGLLSALEIILNDQLNTKNIADVLSKMQKGPALLMAETSMIQKGLKDGAHNELGQAVDEMLSGVARQSPASRLAADLMLVQGKATVNLSQSNQLKKALAGMGEIKGLVTQAIKLLQARSPDANNPRGPGMGGR